MKKSTFWVLSLTWGLPMTVVGLLAAAFLEILGYKPKPWGYCTYYEVGYGWGGVNLGPVFIVERRTWGATKSHEHGHAIQNCYFGILTPFIVCLPSAARWWMRRRKTEKGKRTFAVVLIIAGTVIGSGLGLISALFDAFGWLWLAVIIAIYGILIGIWLLLFEIPKYKNGNSVDYYSIWFEAQASRWGERLIADLNKEET